MTLEGSHPVIRSPIRPGGHGRERQPAQKGRHGQPGGVTGRAEFNRENDQCKGPEA